MENSGERSGGVKIPKRNRSLDLKSLYKSRVSKAAESKGKVSQGNDQQNVKRKRRRNQKEVSLSQFELDAKKRKEEDVNAVKSELESSQKSSGDVEELHGVSLSLGENGNAFNIPKRPRGTGGRKKVENDQVPNLLELPESPDHDEAFNAGVMDDAVTVGESVRLDAFSPGNAGVSKSKTPGKRISSNIRSTRKVSGSNLKSAGKVSNTKSKSVGKVASSNLETPGRVGNSNLETPGWVGDSNPEPEGEVASPGSNLNQKELKEDSKSVHKVIYSNIRPKPKADSKPIGKAINANTRRKRKARNDEIKESRDDGSASMCDGAKENIVAVNSGDSSSKKRQTSTRKKKDFVDSKDGADASKKKHEASISTSVSDKVVADFDGDNEEEQNLERNSGKKNLVAVNRGDTSSKKQRTFNRKKKDLVDGKDGGEVSKKKTEPSVGTIVSDKVIADFDGDAQGGQNVEQDVGKENIVAVNTRDTSSKKRRTFSGKNKALVGGKDGGQASKKKPKPSVGLSLSDKVVADYDRDDAKGKNQEQTGRKEDLVAVNSGEDTSSKKRRTVRRKKSDLIDGKDGGGASKKKPEPSVDTSVSEKIVTDFDEDNGVGENLVKNVGEENLVAVNSGDTSSKKRWTNRRKKKDSTDGKGGQASKSEPPVGLSVSDKIVADPDEGNADEENHEQNGGKGNLVAVNSGDASSKKQWTNGRKKKGSFDGKGGQASKKPSELSVGLSVTDKIVADLGEDNADDQNIERSGREENLVAVDGGDTSSKKRQTNCRKKKDLVDGNDAGKASSKKSEPSAGSSILDKIVADFDEDDDDEENLEENAARMLSSRFDPSCTGYPSKRKSSASQKANESSFPVSSSLDSVGQQVNSSGGSDATLVGDDSRADDQSRALRPRREDKGKGVPRKRRHYYEIPPKDLETHWVLNRKIKVFWPLDESWYFGTVDDYHPECKLYHVKYDDRDEEWVNFYEEKFKLLAYPSEVPGRDRPKKVPKLVHKKAAVPPEDGENSIEADLDSEPIALWLARSSQRSKSLPKSLNRSGTSQMEQPIVAPRSSEKTGLLHSKVADPKGRSDADCEYISANGLLANEFALLVTGTLSINHQVYVRKRSHTSSEVNSSLSRYVKAYGSASGAADPVEPISDSFPTTEKVDSEKEVWSIDHHGKLRLNVWLVDSKKFTFLICLPSFPSWRFSLQTAEASLLNDIFMVQRGALLPTSSSVVLDMLLIDSSRGLNFFLFEGCKKQALSFVFKILIFFTQADELVNHDMQLPVTSIRFRFSGIHMGKHHVFEFHSFSRLQSSKWVCLDSKLLQHFLLLKQLPASECTYDKIKELEYWSLKQCEAHVGLHLSSYAGLNKESTLGILPVGVSQEAYTTRTCHSPLYMPEKPGEAAYVLFSSTKPTSLLTQHLQLLMENSSSTDHSQHDLHEQSTESLPVVDTSIPSQASGLGSESRLGHMIVDISSADQISVPLDGKESISRQASDVARNVNEAFDQTPNPSAARPSLEGGRNSSISSPPGNRYPRWTDKSPKFMRRGFSSGPKKPRSQVQYALPGADYDFGVKQKMQNQRSLPGKRIRRENLKRISDASTRRNFELLVCDANVLVTHGDRGWRECGALIVLEVAERNEWRLAVKLSGFTKYSYKVNNILQPGSTNRYSHAVLWKGGKDWVLEFTDRSQWNLFKEMHEECYNRNVRAASVKNIPIPGVQLIEECDDYGIEAPFAWSSRYRRQLQNDVEMAMDPLNVLYDMDSDDEQWLMSYQERSKGNGFEEITEDILEKTMDIFEKASYVKQRDDFTYDELQELVAGLGSVEYANPIYRHWREKRGRKGMPLIRHLQPPLWERYQRQLKEWENAVARGNSASSVGSQEKTPVPEKPAMFAFCLKPRGLDVRNKNFKHRSHRKYPVSGHLHPGSADHDNLFAFGRRSNSHGDNKVLYTNRVHESPDISPIPPSMRLLSPRDAHYTLSAAVSIASPSPRVFRSKRKKLSQHPSSDNQQTTSHRGRKPGRKNGVQQRNMRLPDSISQMDFYSKGPERHGVGNMDDSELNRCRLRDASSAAQHALELAKVKREKAQILFEKADVAIQNAAVAIMTAEVIKASHESGNGGS